MSPELKSRLSNAALAIVAVASLASAIFLIVGKIGFATLLSDSMSPSVPVGSIVLTKQVATAEVKVGEIVKLPLPDSSAQYVHRVMKVHQGSDGVQLTTKGDNNPAKDPWVLEVTSDETPVVVAWVPLIGFLNVFAGNFVLQMVLVGMVLLLLAMSLIRFLRS